MKKYGVLALLLLIFATLLCGCGGEHRYGEWQIVENTVCDKIGRMQRECLDCGKIDKTDAEVTSAHKYADGKCSVCGKIMSPCNDLEFVLDNETDTYTVASMGDCKSTTVIVPETYEGKPVTKIAEWAFSPVDYLETVVIPQTVTFIGRGALKDNISLTQIIVHKDNPVYHSAGNCLIESATGSVWSGCNASVLPNDGSVKRLEIFSFYGFTGLKTLTFPASLVEFDSMFTEACSGIETLYVDGNNPIFYAVDNCIINREEKELVLGCKNSVIPSDGSVTSIRYSAFHGCTGLNSITIPDGIEKIGGYAFADCTGLTELKLPESVKDITFYAFHGCTGLTEFKIPSKVEYIDMAVFGGCSGLKRVELHDGVYGIDKWAFMGCTSLESIDLPSSLRTIGEDSFSSCKKLRTVTVPASAEKVYANAFKYCDELTEVIFAEPDGWTCVNGEGDEGEIELSDSKKNAVYFAEAVDGVTLERPQT